MPSRAGTFPREAAEARRKAWIRKNRWKLALGALPFVGGSVALGALWPEASLPLWLVMLVFPLVAWGLVESGVTGTYHLESAAMAEGWTSKELGRLRSEGAENIDYIPFAGLDVDHVLVHPSGVYAIDTKYTDTEADLGKGEPDYLIAGWQASAAVSARKIHLFLNKTDHQFHVKVTPLVVVWGSALEGELWERDVPVVRGRKLLDHFRKTLPLPTIDQFKQQEILDALKSFNERRDAYGPAIRNAG